MKIVLAPLSNDFLRDWPIERYRELVELLMADGAAEIVVLGSAAQRPQINQIVRSFPAERVRSLAGRSRWSEAEAMVKAADLVIANNSGIAHVAARMGRPTLCLFATSHDPYEWMPRGPNVTVLFTRTSCAPCCHHGYFGCPFDKHCLRAISAQRAYEEGLKLVSREERPEVRPRARKNPWLGAGLVSKILDIAHKRESGVARG